MNTIFKLTEKGKKDLEEELERRMNDRSVIANKIAVARDFGDLRENAEYASAKEEQSQNESRIKEIDTILKNSEIITVPSNTDAVAVGSTVDLEGASGSKKFTIVGSVEADPSQGRISDESPIGSNLIGKKIGDSFELTTPGGAHIFTIKKIS